MATPDFGGFTIKPVKKTKTRTSSSSNVIKRVLYCKPIVKDDEFIAYINTRDIEGYDKVTYLPFSKESYSLKGKTDIFSINKVDGKYIHIRRNKQQSIDNPGFEGLYTPICILSIYKGYVVKHNGQLEFNITDYAGTVKGDELLLSKSNAKPEIEG